LAESIVGQVNCSLKPVTSPADALELLRRKKTSSPHDFYCYPEEALAFAFTLAKTGHKQESEAELKTIFQKNCFPPDTHAALNDFLSATG
jgi:hypothetical protein